MGAKNFLMLKTHFDEINTRFFLNEFLYGNMLWAIGSLRVFICKYVLYSFGLILRYILRFQVGDRKNELLVQHPETDQTETFPDSEVDVFREAETNNLQFHSREDNQANSNEREAETENSVFMDTNSDVHEDGEFREGETEGCALMESDSDVDEDCKEEEAEQTEGSVFMETVSDCHHDIKDRELETDDCIIRETDTDVNEDTGKKEEETGCSVSIESHGNVLEDSTNKEDEEEEPDSLISMENHSATTTSKCLYVSSKDFCGFVEEPITMSFTFQEFHVGPNVFINSNNTFEKTGKIPDKQFPSNLEEGSSDQQTEKKSLQSLPDSAISKSLLADKQFSEANSEEFSVDLEEKESVSNEILLGNESFRRNYSSASDSDEENMLYNDYSSACDSESESLSSSSSGLIWGNSKQIEDSIMSKFLAFDKAFEGFEPESPVKIRSEKVEDDEYIELEPSMTDLNSWGQEEEDNLKKIEESQWEENLSESDSDEASRDDLEWEHDDLVEQLKTELRNARQGGLPTILEEEEEETESPKVIEDLKPLKLEDKLEYKDQLNEIQKVYRTYAEKMRKLDILNYQTMHSIGLLQVKDPLKLISTPKWSVPISQNLWPRKASKIACDPLMKSVHELHRQLELVYVGQVCLSWEILCWQHRKTQELKQYDPQQNRQYNLVAGEFQLFQVLMNRFLENEPFQGPRVQSYVKNRCVIRNLLQVPAIKDDSMKDRNLTKGNEEDHAIGCGRLADIIKESIEVLREFVRADKDDGNMMLKASQQSGIDPRDSESLNLLMDIRTNLHKKEKRLKDLVRSGNCIVKRFQKHHEDQLNHEQLLAQVELKLISRVVNISKLRKDQLIWCTEKLSRIKFVNRKIHVEPGFALFPC